MACQQGRVFGRVRSSEKQSRHFYLMRRHSRVGGNPDLRLSEIFNDDRSMDFAHGCGLQKYRLRRVSIYSRGQSPRYGSRLQIPASDVSQILESDILDIGEIACSGSQVNGLLNICSKP